MRVKAQLKYGWPKNNIACLNMIKLSQCIEQLNMRKDSTLDATALENYVDTPGVSSSPLPGALRVRNLSSNRICFYLKFWANGSLRE
jgi:hypothetical protein